MRLLIVNLLVLLRSQSLINQVRYSKITNRFCFELYHGGSQSLINQVRYSKWI